MRIDDFIGHVVIVELDSTVTYEGVLHDVKDPEFTDYVKVMNAQSTDWLPRQEIYKIVPVYPKRFVSEE
ncbi:hypothetical protein AB4Z45_16080 [Paenibacillus sp. MCAF9]|uniref:hypothetical protein n=1 Tax=unclassified Paenibacillus TaxID=185978 RepID=UPI003F9B0454